MQRLALINPPRIAGLVAPALAVSVTACGGGDGGDDKPTSSAAVATPAVSTSNPLLAKIPALGESYPAGLSRFVDTETGKPYGLAVTVADDGNVVAYLCDGKSQGRAFSGTIEDGSTTATLEAVKGEGTVTLDLSGDEPRAAQVDAGDLRRTSRSRAPIPAATSARRSRASPAGRSSATPWPSGASRRSRARA
jgi:hypothetical protein